MGLVLVFGSRPESIKLGPIVAELRNVGISPQVVATGQHVELLKGTPAESDLVDSRSLCLRSHGDVTRWLTQAEPRVLQELQKLEASVVVVQGDTMSALVGARAAKTLSLTLCHVEAGVRSSSLEEPWPEERFRREITELADWHYAATTAAFANLLSESIPPSRIRLTGNPVVSALCRYAGASPRPPEAHILFTMHRREWLRSVDLRGFIGGLLVACEEHPLVDVLWPVHPAVRPKLPEFLKPANLWLDPPLPYVDTIDVLSRACGVITDSGGLVEEATTLGVPVAIMRHHNDRPEAVENGTARQFLPTPEGLKEAFDTLCGGGLPRRPSDIYGTPGSAAEIARHLASLSLD